MAGGGYIKLYRGWRDCPALDTADRRDAWLWLLENACWKPMRSKIKGQAIELQRGELTFSQRFLAEKWGWSKSRVDRFIADLRAEGMIETRSKIGATAGHNAGQGQSIIRLCNYEKYQGWENDERGNVEPGSGATAGQQRGKEEEGKKERKNNYAFDGRVIRLSKPDLARWEKAFPSIDVMAALQSRDDWLAQQPEAATRNWFQSTSNWLFSKQQAAASTRGHVEFSGPC